MPEYTLCLNMIVKNESHIIEQTLNNIIDNVKIDYWIICDTGSTDDTKEIIQNFFDKKSIKGELHCDEWRDFGYNRTRALEHAYNKTDYLLIFDADDKIHGKINIPSELSDQNNVRFGSLQFSYYRNVLINNRKRWKYNGVLHEFLSPIDDVSNDVKVIDGSYYIESGKTGARSLDKDKYLKDAIVLETAFINETNDFMKNRYAFYCGQSYKDAKIYDKAIDWYKKVLTLNNWIQEKYYSCYMIGQLYYIEKNFEEAINYWSQGIKYDYERRECISSLMEYYYNKENHFMVNNIYNSTKKYNIDNIDYTKKLFLNIKCNNNVYYYNSISAFYNNDNESGYYCCKKLIENNCNLEETIKNILFYEENIKNDILENQIKLFYKIDDLIYRKECNINESYFNLWEVLFSQVKNYLTTYSNRISDLIENLNNDSDNDEDLNEIDDLNENNNEEIIVFLSFTTCKRFDLFEQTINSLINTWNDYKKIDYWFCVDDNSSKVDKEKMLEQYPFVDFYFKMDQEKGHKNSMNIIYNKLVELKPKYWIHIEDDFLFYKPANYIENAIEGFKQMEYMNIKQFMFNRCYGETIKDYNFGTYIKLDENFAIQDYRINSDKYGTAYWPYFSFRPSIIKVDAILNIGNFETSKQFFEMEYAHKWTNNGYKTGFFNRMTNKHIGKLTYENNKQNAYQMNNEAQFDTNNIKIINLKKRTDRKQNVKTQLDKLGIYNYDFFEAINGYEIEETKKISEIQELFRNNDFSYKKGVIGCALSHIELWKKLVNDNNNDYYLILEDDIEFNPNFKTIYDELTDKLKNIEMLFFGYHMYVNVNKEIKEEYSLLKNEIKVQDFNDNLSLGGFFSYSINKKCAKKLLEYIENNGIQNGIDYLIQKKLYKDGKLDCKELKPHIIKSEYYYYNNVDTDIQNNNEKFDFSNIEKKIMNEDYDISSNLLEQFLFIKGLDQLNNDVYQYKDSDYNMMLKSIQDDNVVGFNTLGFFKKNIDIDNLQKSNYFSNDDGIYIKKKYYEYYIKNKKINNNLISRKNYHELCNIVFTDEKSIDEFVMSEINGNINIDNSKEIYFGILSKLLKDESVKNTLLTTIQYLHYKINIIIIDDFTDSSCVSTFISDINVFVDCHNVMKIYVENWGDNFVSTKIQPIPIGFNSSTLYLLNQYLENEFKENSNKKEFKEHRENKISCNFQYNLLDNLEKCNSGLLPDRKELLNIVENISKENSNSCFVLNEKEDFENYLNNYKKYKFTLSPYGNGMDCHRTWEALLLKTIPIVKTGPLDFLYKYYDLPILIVKDWNELKFITQEKLNTYYDSLYPKFKNIEKMNVEYFLNYKNNNYFKEENIAFITLTNNGYLDYTNNCLKSLEKCGFDKTSLVCYCVDNNSYNKLISNKIEAYYIDNIENRNENLLKCNGSDKEWVLMMSNKIRIIYDALQNNNYVLFTDGDIVFENKDFMEHCYLQLRKHNVDMVTQADNNWLNENNEDWICCGFMFIESNNRTIELFKDLYIKITSEFLDDQPLINSDYCKNKFTYKLLDRNLFSTGGYYEKYLPNAPYMIHFNCFFTDTKREKMKQYHKWYIQEEDKEEKVNTNNEISIEEQRKIQYILIKGADIPNNTALKFNNTIDLQEIVNKCNSDESYVGFNTKGEIKNKMTLMVLNPEFKGEHEGIFVKKHIYDTFVKKIEETRKIKEELKELKKNKEPLPPVREASKETFTPSNSEGSISNNSDEEIDNEIKLEISELEESEVKQEKKYRIKMICDWCSSEQLCKQWKNMCLDEFSWNNIEITWENSNIDYYIIINKPNPKFNEYYEPSKTIIYQMEPWVCFKERKWGIKTWGDWSRPDENKFLHVHSHRKFLNNVQWWVNIPKSIQLSGKKQDRIVNILSNKKCDEGHLKRIELCKTQDYMNISDTFGKDNYFGLNNYSGEVIDERKENILLEYKYHLVVENNKEYNYATEKLWDALICECLPFYWGCPNLEDYLDPLCFVRLDLNDIPGSIEIIKKAMKEDWWSQRINIIRREKEKVINELGFFPNLAKIIKTHEK
jgi:GR25 family glycosyltransferase involved in LPS biosynthesis/molybdopterin-guanine dinucleotide biosynthesis protein A